MSSVQSMIEQANRKIQKSRQKVYATRSNSEQHHARLLLAAEELLAASQVGNQAQVIRALAELEGAAKLSRKYAFPK